MNPHEHAREELRSRRASLLRRLTRIEDELEAHGVSVDSPAAPDAEPSATPTAVVAAFVQSLGREVARIESALRRIEAREYDCCLSCGGGIEAERLERMPYTVNCQRCSGDYPTEYGEQLRSHPGSLRRSLFDLVFLFDAVAVQGGPPREHDLGCARALLGDLARQLPLHFEGEEKGQHFGDAVAAAPHFARRAAKLLAEHDGFAQRLDALVRALAPSGTPPAELSAARDTFRQLALDLLAHEQAESEIVEGAFLYDLGGIA